MSSVEERTGSVKYSIIVSEVRFSVKLVNSGEVLSGVKSPAGNASSTDIGSLQLSFMSLTVQISIAIYMGMLSAFLLKSKNLLTPLISSGSSIVMYMFGELVGITDPLLIT